MPLILRIDVDKPYGRVNLIQKVISKLREDYWFPAISSLGYLDDLNNLLRFLERAEIKAHIFFRRCTLPLNGWAGRSLLKEHQIGHHAEDTRNFETFKKELEEVQEHFMPDVISSFTKHGSGKWKGGRHHYPLYEPEKYLKWADMVSVPFLFGNHENINESCEIYGNNQFYPGGFWIDRPYANYDNSTLQKIIDIGKERNLVVLMHNGCFEVERKIEEAMLLLIKMSREQNVDWITL